MKFLTVCGFLFLAGLLLVPVMGQTPKSDGLVATDSPRVTQIDETDVKSLLTPNGRPLLVNFWATWCVPCREEFPDLVKIDEQFRGKIDFITITLDDPAELNRDVPKFLREMNAKMPTYLLFTNQESEVIGSISPEWSGGLPFSALFNERGEVVFVKQGVIKPEVLTSKIEETLQNMPAVETSSSFDSIDEGAYEAGKSDAQRDISNNIFIYRTSGRPGFGFIRAFSRQIKQNYGVSLVNRGCLVSIETISYDRGYNEVLGKNLIERFGEDVLAKARVEAARLSENKPADVVELKLTVNH